MAFGKIKADTIAYTDTNQQEQNTLVRTLVDNANAISTNTTNIGTNTANIATNTTNISTNATDIATNATAIATKAPIDSPSLTGTPLAVTAAAGTNNTQIATTAFVSTAVSNLVDSAPATLDTLNELAAALGDDANFSTTVTNSIATKLPLAGGTLTGDLTLNGDPDAALKAAPKQYVDTQVSTRATLGLAVALG